MSVVFVAVLFDVAIGVTHIPQIIALKLIEHIRPHEMAVILAQAAGSCDVLIHLKTLYPIGNQARPPYLGFVTVLHWSPKTKLCLSGMGIFVVSSFP